MNAMSVKNVLLSVMVMGLVSCDNDDDDGDTGQFDSLDVTALQSAATAGTWKITRFIEDGEDETADFENYVFSFDTNGNLTADNGTSTFTGSWSVEMDDDDDDDSLELEFEIDFSDPDDVLDDLEDDWYVLGYSDNRIRLAEDDDEMDDDDDLVTFERI